MKKLLLVGVLLAITACEYSTLSPGIDLPTGGHTGGASAGTGGGTSTGGSDPCASGDVGCEPALEAPTGGQGGAGGAGGAADASGGAP